MRLNKKLLFTGAFLLIVAGVTTALILRHAKKNSQPGPNLISVSVRFPLPEVRAPFGVWFAADEKGFFAKEGLKVQFNYGGQTTNPVAMVVSKSDQFGILGGPDTALVAVGKGAPIKILAIIHKDSNFPCLITLKTSGIANVKQLEGKKVGMFPGHISFDVLHNLFRKTGVHVHEVNVAADYTQFLAGKVDAQWAFTTAAAVEFPEKGIAVNVISPADYGILTDGYTVFATDDYIQQHHDVVRGFLAATFKGVIYMVDHPDEVADMVVAQDKTGNLVKWQVRKRIDQYNDVSPHNNPLPPGYFDQAMLQRTYDRLLQEGVITHPFDIRTAYDSEFLKEIDGERYSPPQTQPNDVNPQPEGHGR